MALPAVFTKLIALLYYTFNPIWVKAGRFLGGPLIQITYLILKREYLRETCVSSVQLPQESDIKERATPSGTRTFEGSLNNKDRPTMAMTGCPFARNTKPLPTPVNGPDAVTVSQEILARPQGVTKTRPLVNLLGGAWIQFMIHDWFVLAKDQEAKPIPFKLPDGQIMNLQPAVKGPEDSQINSHDHWWSGCQIYGSTPARNAELRAGVDGKLKLSPDGKYLPLDGNGVELVGFNLNLWSGLQLLHYLFACEHNAVCDMLKAYNPTWSDEQLFSTARKVVTALIARIHTVEWTTAIVQSPAGRATQYILWYGIVGTLLKRKLLGWTKAFRKSGLLNKLLLGLPGLVGQLLFGIPGGDTVLAQGDLPFAHSEEFIAVYRLHCLLPDTVIVHSTSTGQPHTNTTTVPLEALLFKGGTTVNKTYPLPDLLYTLGVGHAGALELRNYPTALRHLTTPSGALLDMAVVDVYRSREARLPLFNDYRKDLHLPPVKSFDELAPNDDEARQKLKQVYSNDVNNIDVMVGLLSEHPLPGFIFGEAIYTIFVLQTQRRLESDRFYTEDFSELVYTEEGMLWVEQTTMTDILRRHVPELQEWLPDKRINAFVPWGNAEKRKLHDKVLWDLLFPFTVNRWLRNMGYDA